LPKVDSEFEEITEGEEEDRKQKLKTKWAALEALVGSEKRIRLIAEDLVQHFERRLEATDGKAMVVCMSRRICVDLYNELIKLRPDWASAEDDDIEAEKKQWRLWSTSLRSSTETSQRQKGGCVALRTKPVECAVAHSTSLRSRFFIASLSFRRSLPFRPAVIAHNSFKLAFGWHCLTSR